jgi:hypothetical protein
MAAMMKRTQRMKRKLPPDANVYFGVRISRELVDRLRRRARDNDRNLGAELNRILRNALDNEGAER